MFRFHYPAISAYSVLIFLGLASLIFSLVEFDSIAGYCDGFFSVENVLHRRLIRFLRSSTAGKSEDEGDPMMESAIEISSGSSSDEEVSEEPIREEVKTRKNPPWLDGILFIFSLYLSQ